MLLQYIVRIYILFIGLNNIISQPIDYITHIPSYNLAYGGMIYDKGNIQFIGDIVDTTGYWGYYIGRLDTAGQLVCFKHYIDSLRVKQLVFAPSLQLDQNRYMAMGFAWRKSRPMLVVYNDQCDTLFTREYKVQPDDSLYYQIMQDIVEVPGTGYVVVGQMGTYRTRDSLRSQIFLLMLDYEFNEIWQMQFGGPHDDLGICASVLTPDTLLLFGLEDIGLYAWPNATTSRYMRVMKISLADGSLFWEKKDIPPHRSSKFDFVHTPDHGYILCAAELIDSLFANGLPTNYYSRNSVFRFNSDFEITWEVTYGKKSIVGDRYTDITESIDHDGVVVVGTVRDYSDTLGFMTVVSKISWTGDSIWTRYYRPIHLEPQVDYFSPSSLEDQILTTQNGYILQTDMFLDSVWDYLYTEQIWFLELDSYGCHTPGCHLISSSHDLNTPDLDSLGFILYPNPGNELLTVQLRGASNEATTLSVCDASGRVMISTPITRLDTQYLIPTRQFPPGVYTLIVSGSGGLPIGTKQFICI